MQFELFFKIGYVSTIPKGFIRTGLYAVCSPILCHDSTGCDEKGDNFATWADTIICIVRLT